MNQGSIKYLNTGSYNYNVGGYRKLILADGVQVWLDADAWTSSACNLERFGSRNWCALIYVDLNGAKKPNQNGRDVFTFALKKNGLYPLGCDSANSSNQCRTDNMGFGCSCRVLREGAMNY